MRWKPTTASRALPEERRPMFVHVVADDGGNVLTLDHLKAMEADEAGLASSADRNDVVVAWATHPPPCRLRWTRRPTDALSTVQDWHASWPWCSRMTSPAP